MDDALQNDELADLLSFARYLAWSDLVRQAYENELEKRGDAVATKPVWGPDFAWMSYWYSSLFVVVEAYEAIRYTDRVIDALLAHPNGYKNLLRRYRNGIYHYQRELRDSRLLTFLGTGDEHVLWVHVLHGEFQRLLRQHVERCCPDEGSKAELKVAIQDLTGYHPDEPKRRHMEATLARALKVVNTEPSPELREQHAEIQGAVADLALALASFDAKHQTHRLELLRRLGIEVVEECVQPGR